MSGGAIYQESLRVLRRLALPEQAERDVVAALEAAHPGPLALLYEAYDQTYTVPFTIIAIVALVALVLPLVTRMPAGTGTAARTPGQRGGGMVGEARGAPPVRGKG